MSRCRCEDCRSHGEVEDSLRALRAEVIPLTPAQRAGLTVSESAATNFLINAVLKPADPLELMRERDEARKIARDLLWQAPLGVRYRQRMIEEHPWLEREPK